MEDKGQVKAVIAASSENFSNAMNVECCQCFGQRTRTTKVKILCWMREDETTNKGSSQISKEIKLGCGGPIMKMKTRSKLVTRLKKF